MKFIFHLIFLTTFTSFSQSTLDSLLNAYSAISTETAEDYDLKSIFANDIAVQYQGLGEEDKAGFYFEQALKHTKSRIDLIEEKGAQEYYDLGFLHKNLGVFYASNLHFENSRLHLNSAKDYFDTLGTYLTYEENNYYQHGLYGSILTFYFHLEKIDSAFWALKMMNDFIPPKDLELSARINQYRITGELHSAKKQYQEAIIYFEKALEICSPNSFDYYHLIYALGAKYYYQNDFHGAISILSEKGGVYLNSWQSNSEALTADNKFQDCYFLKAFCFSRLQAENIHYLDSAFFYYRKGFELNQSFLFDPHREHSGSFLFHPENKVYGYISLGHDFLKQKESSDLIDLIFQQINIYQSFQYHHFLHDEGSYKTLVKYIKRLQFEMESIMMEKDHEFTDQDALLSEKMKIYVALQEKAKNYAPKTTDTFQLSDYYSDKKTLINYWSTSELEDSIYIVYKNKQREGVIKVPFKNPKESLHLFKQCVYGFQPIPDTLNTALYEALIAPLKAHSLFDLIVYPTQQFQGFPFEAIQLPTGDYSITKFSFQYESSLGFSGNRKKEIEITSQDMSLFLPHFFSNPNLSPLLNGEKEASEISQLTGSDVRNGESASLAQFKKDLRQRKMIHLITHTIINDSNPSQSYIAFNQSPGKDALYLNELLTLENSSQIITLASCNTQQGTIDKGFGLQSFANFFQFSGTPSVIASLWEVSDISSQKIMVEFYAQLQKGKTLSEALRQAKLNYLNEQDDLMSHPYFWANYALFGNDPKVKFKSDKNSWTVYLWAGLPLFLFIILYFKRKRTS